MTWRRLGIPSLGGSPPPYRPLYPVCTCLKVWTRVRTMSYYNGALTLDSGWGAWSAAYTWPAGGDAMNTPGNDRHTDVLIETAGRVQSWQIVIQDREDNLTTGVPTYSLYTVDMAPGVVTTFSYSASSNTHHYAWKNMILIPAEGY